MSIATKTFYTIKCDRCGKMPDEDVHEFRYWDDGDVLMDIFEEWEEIGNRHSCPDCWTWSEDESEIIFKSNPEDNGA